jgi:uncharacterized membrane protein YfcA
VALAAAFAIALLATPAGISGAVLLLPFQVSVLGTPSPAVTPTNLLFNVAATPGALYRYWRQGQAGARSICRTFACARAGHASAPAVTGSPASRQSGSPPSSGRAENPRARSSRTASGANTQNRPRQ